MLERRRSDRTSWPTRYFGIGDSLRRLAACGRRRCTLAADYRSRSVTIGNRVRASLPGDRAVKGVADDIDDLGRLRASTPATKW